MSAARRLVHPQTIWLRRALFQIHLWCGIGLGLYVFLIYWLAYLHFGRVNGIGIPCGGRDCATRRRKPPGRFSVWRQR